MTIILADDRERGKQYYQDYEVRYVTLYGGRNMDEKNSALINDLRDRGINTMGAVGKSSMKAQMGLSDKLDAKYSLILGQVEVKEGTIILRDMNKGSQETIPYEGIVDKMVELLGEKTLASKKLWEE